MALSFISITPSQGFSSGKTRVSIRGTDFDAPIIPPVGSGLSGPSTPTMKIKFGDLEATDLRVYEDPSVPGEFVCECTTPRFLGDPDALRAGPIDVDLTLENLVTPATVVESNAFSYELEDITDPTAFIMPRTVETIIMELLRQVSVKDVSIFAHTDYDRETADGLDTVAIAETPYVELVGPRMPRSHGAYQQMDPFYEDLGGGAWNEHIAPEVMDLEFSYSVIAETPQQALAICGQMIKFFRENGRLQVQKDRASVAQGFWDFDVDLQESASLNLTGRNDNLATAGPGSFVIRGVPIDRVDGLIFDRILEVDGSGARVSKEAL